MKSNELMNNYANYTIAELQKVMLGSNMHVDPSNKLWQQGAEQKIQNMRQEVIKHAEKGVAPQE